MQSSVFGKFIFLVYNDVLFFLVFDYISFFFFSRSDHCRRWCEVMKELREVSLQRSFEKFSKELWEKRKEQERRSLLRPSALTAIIQLMHARSLWPSVMAELTLKFAYKKTECFEKVMEEQEDWTTDLDDDDDDDDDDAPAPIQRPPLQIRRRRGRRGKPLFVRFAPY